MTNVDLNTIEKWLLMEPSKDQAIEREVRAWKKAKESGQVFFLSSADWPTGLVLGWFKLIASNNRVKVYYSLDSSSWNGWYFEIHRLSLVMKSLFLSFSVLSLRKKTACLATQRWILISHFFREEGKTGWPGPTPPIHTWLSSNYVQYHLKYSLHLTFASQKLQVSWNRIMWTFVFTTSKKNSHLPIQTVFSIREHSWSIISLLVHLSHGEHANSLEMTAE